MNDARDSAPSPQASVWTLLPAVAVSLAALCLFAMQNPWLGYAVLVSGLVWALLVNVELFRDLLLIGIGIGILSTTSVQADVSWVGIARIGLVLVLALLVPLLVDRLIYRRRAIRFPWRGMQRRNRAELAYMVAVPALGWLLLPFYFIRSGVYENWPHVTGSAELLRFFVGVNAVGTWDELFFIATCFTLLRRHFPVWLANLLQASIFVSFLWELGYRSWGPLLTIPFALLQGLLFSRTKSLGYVLIVHLLFDAIVFLSIVHAHNRDWIPIFIY